MAKRKHPDVQKIGYATCSRCNAKADVKAIEGNGKTDALGVVIDCPKCKFRPLVGFTDREQLRRIEQHKKLLARYRTATPAQRGVIMKRVKAMSNEEDEWLATIAHQ